MKSSSLPGLKIKSSEAVVMQQQDRVDACLAQYN